MSVVTLPEWLEVAGEPFATPAIAHESLMPLKGRVLRGRNVTMSGARGTRPYAGIDHELDTTLTWRVNGFRDPDGVQHDNPGEGLELNLAYYESALFEPRDPTTGTVPVTLRLQGRSLVGALQPWTWDPVQTGPATATVLTRVILPAGRWTEVTP